MPQPGTELAIFLDRKPYIWLWRPTYRILGPLIRQWKVVISGGERVAPDYESRFSALETSQRQTSQLLEQALNAMLSDRQDRHAIEELHTVVTSALSQHAAEVSAKNAAQWEAIEQLILALLGDSERCRLARNNDQASNLDSTPSVNKVA